MSSPPEANVLPSSTGRPPYHLCVAQMPHISKAIKSRRAKQGCINYKPCKICGNLFNIYTDEPPLRVNSSVLFATVPPPNQNKPKEITHERLLRRFLIKHGYWKSSGVESQNTCDEPSNQDTGNGPKNQDDTSNGPLNDNDSFRQMLDQATSVEPVDHPRFSNASGDIQLNTDSESCIEVD